MKITVIRKGWVNDQQFVCFFCWDCGKATVKHDNWFGYAIESGYLETVKPMVP